MPIINKQIIKEIKTVISHRLKQAIKNFMEKCGGNQFTISVYQRKIVCSLVLGFIMYQRKFNLVLKALIKISSK